MNQCTRGYLLSTRLNRNFLHRQRLDQKLFRRLLVRGDVVELVNSGERGSLEEIRGGGWYAIRLFNSSKIIKRRFSDFRQYEEPLEGVKKVLPSLHIHDLDSILNKADKSVVDDEYLTQIEYFSSKRKWVLFSDLHCSSTTLSTCLKVLQKVHEEALTQEAGILFLGDFWHHRGTIRFDCLNAVLQELRTWKVPLLMIPGNHDQISFNLVADHGLMPLQNAFFLENSKIKGVLILSQPTLFRHALFVPHVRDTASLESIIMSKEAKSSMTKALFIHADVTGAYMNDNILSQSGISPKCFPPHKPIYSGHFHKPHLLTNPGIQIEYVGSPYQISLSEAQQEKALLLLNHDWNCTHRIPIDIGRRHYKFHNLHDALTHQMQMREGDRVVLTLDPNEHITNNHSKVQLDQFTQNLTSRNIQVELRELKSQNIIGQSTNFVEEVEDLSPKATLEAYFKYESNNNTQLQQDALHLLEKVIDSSTNEQMPLFSNFTYLQFDSITLQGFGSFKTKVTYPLSNRGLVLLRGINKETGFDSNGSGKSTLLASILWALTGSIDSRPIDDFKVTDIINDESKVAQVTLKGKINDATFTITRAKSSSRSMLTFLFNHQDLTRQSPKETQLCINEKLCTSIDTQLMIQTFFYGQHDTNTLLDSTDVKMKEELSKVTPVHIWKEASVLARKQAKDYSLQTSQLDGMISIRSKDEALLLNKCNDAQSHMNQTKYDMTYLAQQQLSQLQEIESKLSNLTYLDDQIFSSQINIQQSSKELSILQNTKIEYEQERDNAIKVLQDQLKHKEALVNDATNFKSKKETELHYAQERLFQSQENLETVLSKYNISNNDSIKDNTLPKICPTCHQTIQEENTHSHTIFLQTMQQEVSKAKKIPLEIQNEITDITNELSDANLNLAEKEKSFNDINNDITNLEDKWNSQIQTIEKNIMKAREEINEKTLQVSEMALELKRQSELQSNKLKIESMIQKSNDQIQHSISNYESLSKQLTQMQNEINTLESKRNMTQANSKKMSDLIEVFGARGIQAFVLQNTLASLQSSTQYYLDILSDGAQHLELQIDSSDRISRTAMIRSNKGEFVTRPLSSLSGGQWRRCCLATKLGFSDLVRKRGRFSSSLLILDEPLTHLDTAGRSYVGQVLKQLVQRREQKKGIESIIVILQDLVAQELEDSFDFIDHVVKDDGTSSVDIDFDDNIS